MLIYLHLLNHPYLVSQPVSAILRLPSAGWTTWKMPWDSHSLPPAIWPSDWQLSLGTLVSIDNVPVRMGIGAEGRAVLCVPYLWTAADDRSGHLASFRIVVGCNPEWGQNRHLLQSGFSIVVSQTQSKSGPAVILLSIRTRTQATSTCLWKNPWLGCWAPVRKIIYGDRRWLVLCCSLFSWTVCSFPLRWLNNVCCRWWYKPASCRDSDFSGQLATYIDVSYNATGYILLIQGE